jgi:hypothetical protein
LLPGFLLSATILRIVPEQEPRMSKVVELNTEFYRELPPQRVLAAASDADLQAVLVIGLDQDDELYVASSTGDPMENLWLAERFKHKLMTGDLLAE